MRRERRYPMGLKVMAAGAAVGVVLALVGGVGCVVSVAGLFATADGRIDRIRPELLAEAEPPATISLTLERGEHAVYVIAEDGDLPGRDRSVRLDVRVTGPDDEVVRVRSNEQPVGYGDPRSRARLALVGRFDAPRAGRYRIEAREVPGAHPIDLVGVGEDPGFGEDVGPWMVGVLLGFFAGAGGLAMATGLGIGTALWSASLPRRTPAAAP